MAAAKKMRLTFLWADRAAVDEDFAQGYSKDLVDWAGKFYKDYDLELDVVPKPGDRDAAYGHALVKENGSDPDVTTGLELAGIYAKAVKPLAEELQQLSKKSNELFGQIFDNERETRDALQKFASLPVIDWPANAARLTSAFAELTLNTAERELTEKRWQDALNEIRTGVDALYAFEKRAGDFDVPVRLDIGDKVAEKGNPAISGEERLKVVFCRFKLSPGLAAAKGPQPHGITTTPGSSANSVNGRPLFRGPIILVNLLRPERITLAHEMVHAAGRSHIPDFDRMKSIGKIIDGIKLDLAAKKIVLPDFFERVDGGYFDGPADDIINYNSKGKEPGQVKLYDKKLMEDSFFVKTP